METNSDQMVFIISDDQNVIDNLSDTQFHFFSKIRFFSSNDSIEMNLVFSKMSQCLVFLDIDITNRKKIIFILQSHSNNILCLYFIKNVKEKKKITQYCVSKEEKFILKDLTLTESVLNLILNYENLTNEALADANKECLSFRNLSFGDYCQNTINHFSEQQKMCLIKYNLNFIYKLPGLILLTENDSEKIIFINKNTEVLIRKTKETFKDKKISEILHISGDFAKWKHCFESIDFREDINGGLYFLSSEKIELYNHCYKFFMLIPVSVKKLNFSDSNENFLSTEITESVYISQLMNEEICSALSTVRILIGTIQRNFSNYLNSGELLMNLDKILTGIIEKVSNAAGNIFPYLLKHFGPVDAFREYCNSRDYKVNITNNINFRTDFLTETIVYKLFTDLIELLKDYRPHSSINIFLKHNVNTLALRIVENNFMDEFNHSQKKEEFYIKVEKSLARVKLIMGTYNLQENQKKSLILNAKFPYIKQ